MFVMHFVCSTNGIKVRVFDVAQPFESAVDIDVVDQKVGQTISCNAKPNPDRQIVLVHEAEHDTQPRRNGINQKENVVFLEKARLYLMVIFMKIPHNAMHDVFVRSPRHKFHSEKSSKCNCRTPPTNKRKFKKVKNIVI